VDLGYALISTIKQPRGAASVSLQAEDEPWELGLQRAGALVLVTEFVGGPSPRVETFEQATGYDDLRTAIIGAIEQALGADLPQQSRSALKTARCRLLELALPE